MERPIVKFKGLVMLIRGFFEGIKEPVKHMLADVKEEQPMQQQIVYAEFEEAINQWEARTQKRVERSFTAGKSYEEGGKKVTEWSGDEWKNFAEFLGSREASLYRRKWKVDLTQVLREIAEQQPEMRIEGEEDYELKLEEIRKSGL